MMIVRNNLGNNNVVFLLKSQSQEQHLPIAGNSKAHNGSERICWTSNLTSYNDASYSCSLPTVKNRPKDKDTQTVKDAHSDRPGNE
jgi:hypothetical protein